MSGEHHVLVSQSRLKCIAYVAKSRAISFRQETAQYPSQSGFELREEVAQHT